MTSSFQLEKQPQGQAFSGGAGRLLLLSVGITILVVTLMGADLFFRLPGQTKEAEKWMERFSLVAPAIWTAGSPERHPETIHPGVDLRFAPGLENAP